MEKQDQLIIFAYTTKSLTTGMQQTRSLRKAFARLLLGVLLLLHVGYVLHSAMHLECGETVVVAATQTHDEASSDYAHCQLCDLGLLPLVTSVEQPILLVATLALIAMLGVKGIRRVAITTRAYTSLRAPPAL